MFTPSIAREGDKLVARTGLPFAILTLGSLLRRVVIDPRARTITVKRRILWFIATTRVIPFDQIRTIIYRYDDMNPFTALGGTGDAKDNFMVGLAVVGSRDPLHLFSFVGEGSFQNNSRMPDWYYWKEFTFDYRGSQEQESRAFVNLLEKITNKPVGPS